MSTRANWTDERTKVFILACDKELKAGRHTDNSGFKSQGWNNILHEFNEEQSKLNDFVKAYNKDQIMSKYSDLKGKYRIVTFLRKQSGFGWDEDNKMPVAPEPVWDRMVEAHPETSPYRKGKLFMYDELDALFCGTMATGDFASASGGDPSRPSLSIRQSEDTTLTGESSNSNSSMSSTIPASVTTSSTVSSSALASTSVMSSSSTTTATARSTTTASAATSTAAAPANVPRPRVRTKTDAVMEGVKELVEMARGKQNPEAQAAPALLGVQACREFEWNHARESDPQVKIAKAIGLLPLEVNSHLFSIDISLIK